MYRLVWRITYFIPRTSCEVQRLYGKYVPLPRSCKSPPLFDYFDQLETRILTNLTKYNRFHIYWINNLEKTFCIHLVGQD